MKTVTVNGIEFSHDDIFNVVDDFYTRVQNDPLLRVPFESVHDWPEHIKRLTHFWWMRFGGDRYMPISYDPVEKHFLAGFNREFLTQWLFLFDETLKTHLPPAQVALWKLISERMGDSLTMKNDALKRSHGSL